MKERIGLIAGSGQLPMLFARAARAQGLEVVSVAHVGETSPELEPLVDQLSWVRVGQLNRIQQTFRRAGVQKAVMAGGIGHARALTEARPDWGTVRVLARLRSFQDDALLRAVAADFESAGIQIVSPTIFLKEVMAPAGLLSGPELSALQVKDVQLGVDVARKLGEADVGQTVVLRQGHVLAVEALEGTDETIERGCRLGGAGAVVVKLFKPGQDERFDLPTVGPKTLTTMTNGRAAVLAVQAHKTILLDAAEVIRMSKEAGISVLGVTP